jgi:hypothetical protein
MSAIFIPNFSHGLNRLRPQAVGEVGTLWNAKNCVINRGGDVESAKKFVPEYVLPSGTFGLAGVNGTPYVFGTGTKPTGMPAAVSYQQLTYGGSANLVKIHDAKPFAAKLYVIAEFDDGDIEHFYGGARVTEWENVADTAFTALTYSAVAKWLARKINARDDVDAIAVDNRVVITAVTPGTSFTLSTSTVDNAHVASSAPTAAISHLQANVAEVDEVRASGTVTITGGSSSPGINRVGQIAVGAHNLLSAPVDFVLDDAATANAVALAITSAAVAGYTATAAGAVITILAPPGLGATVNGTAPTVTAAGDVTTSTTNLADGVTAVAAQTQIDQVTISATSVDTLDSWKITVNSTDYISTGRSSCTGTLAHVVYQRVWVPTGTVLNFCKLGDATVWSTMAGVASTDPGFIDTSQDSEGADDITSLAEHNDGTAIFSDTNIRIYTLDTDATAIKILQTIENTGSIATKVPLQYGSTEVYYLAMTGLASIRSRLGSNFVVTLDVATAIATYLQDFIDQVGDTVVRDAAAAIEPRDGRFMMAIANKVFALSQFADTEVMAWTEIDLPFTVEEFARIGRRIMARAGNTIYVYGGVAGDVYPDPDEAPIDILTPFLSGDDPSGKKTSGGFDLMAEGVWDCELLVDPNDTSKTADVGVIGKITYPRGSLRVPLSTTQVAAHLTCSSGGRATLSNLMIHFDPGESA